MKKGGKKSGGKKKGGRYYATAFLLLVLLAPPAYAQTTVAQGPPGESTEPWFVTGSFVFGAPQHVICDSGCTPGGSFLDNATFTVGTTAVQPIAGVRLDAPADVVDGNAAAARITPKRGVHVNLRSNNGTELFPAPSALSDAFANPTTVPVGGFTMVWSGAQWFRWDGSVSCFTGCSDATIDGGAFTAGSSAIVIAGAVVDDVATNQVNEDSKGAFRMTPDRILYNKPISGPATATASDTLNVLDEAVTVSLEGFAGAGFTLNPSAFVGTLFLEQTPNGTDWYNTVAWDSSTGAGWTALIINPAISGASFAAYIGGYEKQYRVRVQAYTSGSVDVTLNASTLQSAHDATNSAEGGAPFALATVAGLDEFGAVRTTQLRNAPPAAGDYGVVVRTAPNSVIESITQQVAVTSSAGSNSLSVQGSAADGTAVDGRPVRIAGKDGSGNTQDVVTDAAGELQIDVLTLPAVTGTVTANAGTNLNTSALALSAPQTDGTQKTQIVDSGGAVVNATGTSLDVNCTGGCGGAATFADNSAFTFGTTPIGNIGAVVDDAAPNAVAENSAGTPRMSANRNLYGTIRDAAGNERGANVTAGNALMVDGSAVTQPVSIAAAVPVTDNGGSLTVDAPVGTPVFVRLSDGLAAIATLPVSLATLPALVAGTANIGDVDVLTFPDNEPFNIAQMNGVAVTMGNGPSGTGVQRVTLANDSTGVVALTGTLPAFGATPTMNVGTFPDNEPINVAQINGVTPLMGVGASGTGAQRVAALIHDGTDTALVSAAGNLQVDCVVGCAAAATANTATINSSESVAAPTAAVWYIKRQWALPASAVAVPTRAWAAVTTAASRTMIGIINSLGTLNVGTNAFAATNSVASPRFYGRLIGCVTTVFSATADTITPTYTDELGNSQATVGVVFASATPVGNCYEFPLATAAGPTADSGVRAVTAATDSAATTGVVTFYGFTPLLDSLGPAAVLDQTTFYDAGQLSSTEQIVILLMQAATTAQQRSAGITMSIR